MNNTEVRKITALAQYRESQNNITPRTAIEQFISANQSDAQTPAVVFQNTAGPVTRKRKNQENSKLNSNKEESSLEASVDEQLDEDSVSSENNSDIRDNTLLRRSSRSRRSKNVEITMNDVDPERDLTRPTNLSTTVNNVTDFNISEDSMEETRVGRKRKVKTQGFKHFTEDDFNITVKTKKDKNQATTLGLTMGEINDMTTNDSVLIDERMAKKRRRMLDQKARKQRAGTWDFSGIDAPANTDEVAEKPSTDENDKERSTTKPTSQDQQNSEGSESGSLNFSDTDEDTLEAEKLSKSKASQNKKVLLAKDGFDDISLSKTLTPSKSMLNDVESVPVEVPDVIMDEDQVDKETDQLPSEENTPVVSSKVKKTGAIKASDFEDITLTKESSMRNNEVSLLKNTLSPGSRELTNKVNSDKADESFESFATKQAQAKSRRKSVFEAGLGDVPVDKTLMLEQTRVFRPEVESTRIADLDEKSPAGRVKPGRDTSTPNDSRPTRETRDSLRNRDLSNTVHAAAPIIEENLGDDAEKSRHSRTTAIDPHLPTPQIMEVNLDKLLIKSRGYTAL